ncbi:staygreen family protein [Clostridium paridis]|uniref:Staygreen family protein n=1 Tax=Clostridium paridis TaxID=2803863 RepID=A0A937FH71_9CLOT|nr:staygreen family protein [Clostridium paridis]MBL4931953.1 staygreen family protein [Clostridium paridis]
MSSLNTEKLSVEFGSGTTPTAPIIPRRYTLTHSDITAELFLTICSDYAYGEFTHMRDEVLGEWLNADEIYLFHVSLMLDGEFGPNTRNIVFRRELPLALEAIRYGDRKLFILNPILDICPIIVNFNSADPYYNSIENWGYFSEYDITKS